MCVISFNPITLGRNFYPHITDDEREGQSSLIPHILEPGFDPGVSSYSHVLFSLGLSRDDEEGVHGVVNDCE